MLLLKKAKASFISGCWKLEVLTFSFLQFSEVPSLPSSARYFLYNEEIHDNSIY